MRPVVAAARGARHHARGAVGRAVEAGRGAEPARGLEGVLTDAMCNRIIEETISPAFRQGNFYGGIDAALEQMMRLIQGEPLPPPDRGWHPGERSHGGGPLPFVLFAVLAGSV